MRSIAQRYMRQHELPGVVLMASVPPEGSLGSMLENLLRNPMTEVAHVMFLDTRWRYVTDHLVKWLDERLAAHG